MKCIKSLQSDEVTRVSNKVAEQSVDMQTHFYVSKKEWKSKVRDLSKKSK